MMANSCHIILKVISKACKKEKSRACNLKDICDNYPSRIGLTRCCNQAFTQQRNMNSISDRLHV